VDYWGLDASTDWRALNLVLDGSLQKLIVTMEMTNYDDGEADTDELTQSNVLKKQVRESSSQCPLLVL
jgi:hypothetical protein